MKVILLLIVVFNFLFHSKSIAQNVDNLIYTEVDQDAEFLGGYPAIMKFIQDHLSYPRTVIEKNIQGKVILKFIVERNGSVSNVSVVKGIPGCQECDEEALQIVSNMNNWNPAKNSEKAVRQWKTLPIIFALE